VEDIGNQKRSTMKETGEYWREVARKGPKPRVFGDFVPTMMPSKPPGLEKVKCCEGFGCKCNVFKVLAEDDSDEEETEVFNIQTVKAHEVQAVENLGKGRKQETKKNWASLGIGDIVVDSAADESCWPKGLGDAFETKPSRKNIILKTANGGEMGHYGEKEITFQNGSDDDIVGLKFQVTDVRKPLLAVRRLVEKGNVVSFGLEADQNFIHNVQSGKKIMMEKKGGAFVIKAHFVKEVEAGFARQVR
jgi:hypothetical protein